MTSNAPTFAEYVTTKRIQGAYDRFLSNGVIETFVIFGKKHRYLKAHTRKWSIAGKWKRLATMTYQSLLRARFAGVTNSRRRMEGFVYMAIAYHYLGLESTDPDEVLRAIYSEHNPLSEQIEDHINLTKAYHTEMKPERHYIKLTSNTDEL
jgi:hypothetical protein